MNELNFNVLIAIVAKAMKDNLNITTSYTRITVTTEDDKYICMDLYEKDDEISDGKNYIELESDRGKSILDNITDEDVLRYKLLLKDCEKYEKNKFIEDVNNFFKEKEAEPQTINDLDSDEE